MSAVLLESAHGYAAGPVTDRGALLAFERQKSRMLRLWVVTGLFFMVLPGTILGFTNLLLISAHHGLQGLSPAWIQAHGYSQVFSWIGSFVLGIGFYPQPRTRTNSGRLPILCWSLWTAGLILHWLAAGYLWHWRLSLPASGVLEFAAILLFLYAASQHKLPGAAGHNIQPRSNSRIRPRVEPRMQTVLVSNAALFVAMAINLSLSVRLALQGVTPAIPHDPMQLATLNRLVPQQHYTEQDISPYLWSNGKMPTRSDWKVLAETGFRDFRLKVGGLVERPVELSLADLEKLGETEQITMHHCIQGWSGIAKWGGIARKALIEFVRPTAAAKAVAFFSFGEALYSDAYYDTQSIENVLKAQCLLASRMNGQPLPELFGAPLRLRVVNQLGYKMVKWIERIEFIESEKQLGKGEGGKNEDDEYFDLLPNI